MKRKNIFKLIVSALMLVCMVFSTATAFAGNYTMTIELTTAHYGLAVGILPDELEFSAKVEDAQGNIVNVPVTYMLSADFDTTPAYVRNDTGCFDSNFIRENGAGDYIVKAIATVNGVQVEEEYPFTVYICIVPTR